jgi:hypothetical protein
MAMQLLKSHPDIGLQILNHVSNVNRTVCIGEGAGNQNFSLFGHDLFSKSGKARIVTAISWFDADGIVALKMRYSRSCGAQ